MHKKLFGLICVSVGFGMLFALLFSVFGYLLAIVLMVLGIYMLSGKKR